MSSEHPNFAKKRRDSKNMCVFGHGESGMGHGEESPMPYAPNRRAAIPLQATCGIEFPADFHKNDAHFVSI